MTRYACKSYFDNDAQEKRYAVERQDGDVYRILQRQFITQEGAQVWLERYKQIKKNKHEKKKDAMVRFNLIVTLKVII